MLTEFWKDLVQHLAGPAKSRRQQLVEAQAKVERQIQILKSGPLSPTTGQTADYGAMIADLEDVRMGLDAHLGRINRLQRGGP